MFRLTIEPNPGLTFRGNPVFGLPVPYDVLVWIRSLDTWTLFANGIHYERTSAGSTFCQEPHFGKLGNLEFALLAFRALKHRYLP